MGSMGINLIATLEFFLLTFFCLSSLPQNRFPLSQRGESFRKEESIVIIIITTP